MNHIAKGYRSEQKTVKYLLSMGFVVETVKKTSRRGLSNDFFGCIDHIAIRTQYAPCPEDEVSFRFSSCDLGTILFIQTKSAGYPTKAQREKLIQLEFDLRFNANAKVLCLRWLPRAKLPKLYNIPIKEP
jgi:hypothetical protein